MTDVRGMPARKAANLGAILGFAFLLGACGDQETLLSGGSSDQGNALAILLQDPDGQPVRHAQVRVRADTWTPGAALEMGTFADVLADSLGWAIISGIASGAYVVEAMQDSLVGTTGRIRVDQNVLSRIRLETGSSLVLQSADPSTTGFALRGLDRIGSPAGAGRFAFHQIPRAVLEIETRYPGRVAVNLLPPLHPGTRAVVLVMGDSLRLDSGSMAGLSIPAASGNLFAITNVDLVPNGLSANAQRRLQDGTWATVPSSLRLDSTFGGMFRLTNGSGFSHPQELRWNVWQGRPRELFDFAADGSDTTGFPNPTLNGALRLVDTTGPFVRLDSTQSIQWGLALMDSMPEGAVEIRFRPGPGFQRGHAYSLFANDASRLGIGYLRGMLYFVKGTDFLHRWITSPPDQLLERRWYNILATWGPQGTTLSIDGNLVGWSADISGYSPGTSTVQQLSLYSGAKSGCCLEPLGIVSPQRLDGDIASVHIYDKQPVLWRTLQPKTCQDSVAGDLRARCGATITPRDFDILH